VPAARDRQRLLAASGAAIAVLGRLLAEIPVVVEWHKTRCFPNVAAALQRVSSGHPSTLGEVGAVVMIGGALVVLVLRRGRALGGLSFALGLIVFFFYLSWGLAYRYPPLSARLAPLAGDEQADNSPRLSELAQLSASLVARASSAAPALSGTDAEFLGRINAGLDLGFARWPAALEASPVRGGAFGPAKGSRVSFALSRLQLSGYYFPWTGEAQINVEMPRTLWARVAAHEKAHQRGFARENEATVIGVITCLLSEDRTVFYGGALGLFVSFDRELFRVDPELRREIWSALPARVRDDLSREAAFWKGHEGVAGAVSEKVNDTYLKAQGVKSGVGSYAETTRLMLQAIETPALDLGRRLREAKSEGLE
jgi:hypothetical protein